MAQEKDLSKKTEQERKQAWEEPKLDFVEPKLTKQGALKDITAGFFGSFSPP
ncbi:MAG: hypothetical protein WBO24_11745 [Nitrospirales bacterium]